MRVHRLAVRNFRGVKACEIALPSEGVTIVEGGNEVGKSSMAEALNLVFAYADSSKSTVIRDVQPVHRDVGPEVEVELTTGPYRLVYSKRWLRRPSTTLTIVEPQREQVTGREAHDRVNQILDLTLDRDLWNVLRLEQGGDLGQSGFVLPSLSRALEATVGADVTGPDEDDLWHRIVAEREHYWTPTGRPSAERTRIAERVEAAAAVVEQVKAALRDVEARTDEFARLESEAVELAATQVDLAATEAEALERLRSIDGIRREVAQVEAALRSATSDHERWTQLHTSRTRLSDAMAQRQAALAVSESALAESEPARADAERALAELASRRADALAVLRRAEHAADRAAADSAYRRRQIEIEQFRERLERVVEAQSELERVEPILAGASVTPEIIEALEAAHLELAKAEAAASAGAAAVSASAEVEATVVVDGETVALSPGSVHHLPVASVTEVALPGVVTFTIRAGADSRANAERLAEARESLTRLCQRHGVSGLEDARRTAAARADAERTRTDANKRLNADLRDLTVEGLSRKIASLSVRLAEFEASRAAVPPVPADLDAAQDAEASAIEELARRRTELGQVEAELESAQARTKELGITGAANLERVKMDRAGLADAEEVLAQARAEHPDVELEEHLVSSALARTEAEARMAEVSQALAAADPDTLELVAEAARDARQRGEASIRDNRDQRRSLTAVIEHTGEQGLAHRLDVAQTEVDRLRLEAERLEARAEAARLLHDTFERHRAAARHKYVAPFREQIERLGKIVFGDTLEVTLDDQLGISARTLDGVTVGFHQLSTGAREQFALITRLACAALVSADGEGAPVVFDDVLGWSDPQRLKQMGLALTVAAKNCQVIVFTCTPARFANVGAANVVRLTAEPSSDSISA